MAALTQPSELPVGVHARKTFVETCYDADGHGSKGSSVRGWEIIELYRHVEQKTKEQNFTGVRQRAVEFCRLLGRVITDVPLMADFERCRWVYTKAAQVAAKFRQEKDKLQKKGAYDNSWQPGRNISMRIIGESVFFPYKQADKKAPPPMVSTCTC